MPWCVPPRKEQYRLLRGLLDVSANPVSLFIPGAVDGMPFTAEFLGTDSAGRTSWRVGEGVASGTFTATDEEATAYPSGKLQLSNQ